jgi:hypothetical protein
MVRAGVPGRIAMSISGHRTRAVFDRYDIVREDDIRDAMQRTERYRQMSQFPVTRGGYNDITHYE